MSNMLIKENLKELKRVKSMISIIFAITCVANLYAIYYIVTLGIKGIVGSKILLLTPILILIFIVLIVSAIRFFDNINFDIKNEKLKLKTPYLFKTRGRTYIPIVCKYKDKNFSKFCEYEQFFYIPFLMKR